MVKTEATILITLLTKGALTSQTSKRLLLWGLGRNRIGWDSTADAWHDDYRWCLYIGFILLVYCTLALCCIMAGRWSKGGRNREVHTNEEVSHNNQRRNEVKRHYTTESSYEVIEEEIVGHAPPHRGTTTIVEEQVVAPKRATVVEEHVVVNDPRYNSSRVGYQSNNSYADSMYNSGVRGSRYSQRSQPVYNSGVYEAYPNRI